MPRIRGLNGGGPRWFAAFLCLGFGGLLGCGRGPAEIVADSSPAKHISPGANVILVSVDTLRADHLGCYGYGHPTSPEIDRFRQQAVLFEETVAQAPSTLPSHASMLTSLLPVQHGAFFTRDSALPEGIETLAEVLGAAGYRTGAVTGGGQLAPEFGLDQGFADYLVTEAEAPMSAAVEAALGWLDEGREAPFFLFLHSYEVHHPYTPSREDLALFDAGYEGPLPRKIRKGLLDRINRGEKTIDERDLAHIVAAYDAEIRSMDRALGEFFRELEARGLFEETLIVVTSDHGEEFGEHGVVGWHSHTLFDELLLVPLLVKLPGARHGGATVAEQVRSVDIAPTILAEVGVAAPAQFVGASLLGLMEGEWRPGDLAAVSTQDTVVEVERSSLRDGRWKLYPSSLLRHREAWETGTWLSRRWARMGIRWRPYRLFDLERDPGETVAVEDGSEARRLRAVLEALEAERPRPTPRAVVPAEETVERLRALGYVE